MKNAVCICGGSGGNNGAALLLSEIARGMADAGIFVHTFYLGESKIGFCRDCGQCSAGGGCVQHDDMDILAAALRQADAVCVCSPCRWGSISALLGAFFERSVPPYRASDGEARMPGGKIGISAVVNAGSSVSEAMEAIDSIERWFGRIGIREAGQLHFEGVETPEELLSRKDALTAAYDAGRCVFEYGSTGRVTFSLAVAAERDAPLIASMSAALMEENGMECAAAPRELERRMRMWLRGEHTGILAWVSGKVAGYFLYRPEEGRDGKISYCLEQQYIKPQYRHRGLGAAALRRIVDVCFRDAESLSVDVYDSSPVCNAFWEKSACRPMRISISKPIPIFSDEDPLKIIGWEQKSKGRLL